MTEDSAPVPAMLLCGGSPGQRDAAIARLIEPAAEGQAIAVLRTVAGMFAGPAPLGPHGPHVTVKRAPVGCLCCTAGVMFRVALLELLRSSRPARLVVDLGAGDHVATLEAQMQGGSLARALRLAGRVDLDAAPEPHAVNWPAGMP